MTAGVEVTRSLVSAPLPQIIEKLGLAIAEAQHALDMNAVELVKQMGETMLTIGSTPYNLLTLGFLPSFYAFTEATVEAKLSFTMSESQETSLRVGAQVGVTAKIVMVAASVDASFSRKYSMSSEGASSIAARLVSIPAPDTFLQIIKREYEANLDTL